jgi:catecholate siderophore receptor
MNMNFNFNLEFRSMLLPLVAHLLLALPLAAADAPGATLQGQVLDETRAPLPGAQVAATPEGPGAASSTVTDVRGEFTLTLPAGRYTLTVAAPGFVEARRVLTAPPASDQPQEFVLRVARFRDSVTVNATDGYRVEVISSATKTLTPLRDVPQSITVATRELIQDQLMLSMGDVMRYVPGITTHQGENNRDQVVIRGNNSSADFFVNGVRDDVQYYRDLYNLERVEALKGPSAMVFGRGGGGGVVNRVPKEAGFQPIRELRVQGGSYGHKRVAADVDRPLTGTVAFRVNAFYEDSGSFRDAVGLERYGLNPTLTLAPRPETRVTMGYERLHDTRVADRGLPSFQGRPAGLDVSTFFGDPEQSHVRADVHLGSAAVEHRVGRVTLRNRTLFGDYDRFYQNFVPGAVTADQAGVALSAYNTATARQNLFNQTDVTYAVSTGALRHTLLGGVELGRQLTDNFRTTGFFGGTATSITVPYADPAPITTPLTFRQSATDADNHLRTRVSAAYVQDQVALSEAVQVIGGLRFDRFDLEYHNNRTGETLQRTDDLVSPRAGIVFKPVTPVSVYGSYGVSYLPSSGDQFSSLTTITQQVKPERFRNYEVGVKWDARPGLSLTTAVYRLDRTNTRSSDPNDPTRIVQTGSQRTDGYELGLQGRITPAWKVAGGYAYQDAFVTSATTAARAGAQVPQVPRHTLSLWNSYQFLPRLAAGLGVVYRSDMYAAIDNTVTLPGYTRVDAAVFYTLSASLRLQANVENLFDRTYYVNADNNNNISPGFRRAIRIGLTAAF